jgi:hypothetical protein
MRIQHFTCTLPGMPALGTVSHSLAGLEDAILKALEQAQPQVCTGLLRWAIVAVETATQQCSEPACPAASPGTSQPTTPPGQQTFHIEGMAFMQTPADKPQ